MPFWKRKKTEAEKALDRLHQQLQNEREEEQRKAERQQENRLRVISERNEILAFAFLCDALPKFYMQFDIVEISAVVLVAAAEIVGVTRIENVQDPSDDTEEFDKERVWVDINLGTRICSISVFRERDRSDTIAPGQAVLFDRRGNLRDIVFLEEIAGSGRFVRLPSQSTVRQMFGFPADPRTSQEAPE